MDINQLTQLATQWCPLVYLNADEKYLPCDVDWYISNSQLFANGVLVAGQPIPLTAAYLSTSNSNTYLVPSDTAKNGQNCAPIYVRVTVPDAALDCFDLEYWFMYGFNGPSSVGMDLEIFDKTKPSQTVPIPPFGQHEADWEHAIVRLDNNLNFNKLYLAQHGWGGSFDEGEFEQQNGRPVIYSAVNSHASYNKQGSFSIKSIPIGVSEVKINLGLFDNTDKGILWDCLSNGTGIQLCSVNVRGIDDPAIDWTKYMGHYGSPTDQNAAVTGATGLIWGVLEKFIPTKILRHTVEHEIRKKITEFLTDCASTILPGGPAAPAAHSDWTNGIPSLKSEQLAMAH